MAAPQEDPSMDWKTDKIKRKRGDELTATPESAAAAANALLHPPATPSPDRRRPRVGLPSSEPPAPPIA